MPPKPKCTREEVARTAFQMIKEEGLAALTARELGKRLGTSASPIFTIFKNMEDVKMAARELALVEFMDYISDYQEYVPAFKRIGMMMVSYAIHEPELYKLLFMQEHVGVVGLHETLKDLGGVDRVCIDLIIRDYGMTEEQATLMFEQLWTQAYGLGVMCAMKVCDLEEEEIGNRLGIMFAGMTMLIKSGKINEIYAFSSKGEGDLFQGKKVSDVPYV